MSDFTNNNGIIERNQEIGESGYPIVKMGNTKNIRTILNMSGAQKLTADSVILMIEKYFSNGVDTRIKTVGKGNNARTVEVPAPTIVGLALWLGFTSIRDLKIYMRENEGSDVVNAIKKGVSFIERYNAQNLQHGNVRGAIFALKNMGWSDKVEIETTNVDRLGEVFEGAVIDGEDRAKQKLREQKKVIEHLEKQTEAEEDNL